MPSQLRFSPQPQALHTPTVRCGLQGAAVVRYLIGDAPLRGWTIGYRSAARHESWLIVTRHRYGHEDLQRSSNLVKHLFSKTVFTILHQPYFLWTKSLFLLATHQADHRPIYRRCSFFKVPVYKVGPAGLARSGETLIVDGTVAFDTQRYHRKWYPFERPTVQSSINSGTQGWDRRTIGHCSIGYCCTFSLLLSHWSALSYRPDRTYGQCSQHDRRPTGHEFLVYPIP